MKTVVLTDEVIELINRACSYRRIASRYDDYPDDSPEKEQGWEYYVDESEWSAISACREIAKQFQSPRGQSLWVDGTAGTTELSLEAYTDAENCDGFSGSFLLWQNEAACIKGVKGLWAVQRFGSDDEPGECSAPVMAYFKDLNSARSFVEAIMESDGYPVQERTFDGARKTSIGNIAGGFC